MKKFLPYIIIAVIIIVLVVLSLPKDEGTVLTDSGDQVETGIVGDANDTNMQMEEEDHAMVDNNEEDSNMIETPDQVDSVPVGISVGNQAPNFVLETFDSGLVELASINKPVIIDFWAAWCPFCIEELPDLEAAHQEYKDDIVFLGIHRSETESTSKGQEFADDKGVTYDLLKDTTGEVYKTYTGGQRAMPVAYFIDENGIIKERVLGPKSEARLKQSIDKLLN